MPKRISLSYYPWITQSISGSELAGAIAAFADLLRVELRKTIDPTVELDLLKEMEIPDQLTELKAPPAGDVIGKIGLLNPIGYALAHVDMPAVEAVTVIRRKIVKAGPTYNAQLYTHRKTAIKTVKGARGRSMAFGSPQSTSNFLVPAIMLLKEGVHPLNGFTRVEFTGGHDKAAIAVYEGRLEVGAGHDGVISDLSNRAGYGDADQVLVRLAFSDDIPSDPVAVHASAPKVRDQIRDALLAVATPDKPDSAGNKAVYRFWGTKEGFQATSPEAYGGLIVLMKQLGLGPDDMLRKI